MACDPEALDEGESAPDAVRDWVAVLRGVRVPEADDEGEADGEPEADAEAVADGEPVPEAVGVGDAPAEGDRPDAVGDSVASAD